MVDIVKQLREDAKLTAHVDTLRVMCGWGADEIERLRAEALRDKERLLVALRVARQWMPQHPLPNTGAVEDCALVDAEFTPKEGET